jgi:hypothetical protein
MAFTDPIGLNDSVAALQNFTKISQIGGRSEWVENDATAINRRRLIIQHQNAGTSVAKGQTPIRRHSVQMIHERYNATLGKMEKLTQNWSWTVDPGASSITATDIADQLAFMKNFFPNTATLDKLLRDET